MYINMSSTRKTIVLAFDPPSLNSFCYSHADLLIIENIRDTFARRYLDIYEICNCRSTAVNRTLNTFHSDSIVTAFP
jgi:hypothetical protein